MDRTAARQLLGVGEDASEAEVHAAYWALRAHVEERAHRSASADFRAERARELLALEDALRLLAPREGRQLLARGAVWALAAAALVLAALLAVLLTRSGQPGSTEPGLASELAGAEAPGPEPAPAGGEPGSGPAAAAGPATLAVRANLSGARFALLEPASGSPLGEGPADGRSLVVPAGEYELAVQHPDCPDVWTQSLSLPPGDVREVEGEICTDTGFLVVRSNVSGDRVRIDGQARGGTGPQPHPVPAGDREVRVEKTGYTTWSERVAVPPAETVTVRAVLRSLAAPEAEPSAPAEDGFPPRLESLREGYTGWHDAVRRRMLARYDEDGSGRIDREEEVRSIPCEEWRALERAYEQGGLAVPMSRLYGFDGSAWVEGALGFTFAVRDLAYERMKECGLE